MPSNQNIDFYPLQTNGSFAYPSQDAFDLIPNKLYVWQIQRTYDTTLGTQNNKSEIIDNRKSDLGVLICGSGNGVAMTANKYKKVRAALCWSEEIAKLAKQHNNANVVCIPARFISKEDALQIIRSFIDTKFEGGRHERRVNKI